MTGHSSGKRTTSNDTDVSPPPPKRRQQSTTTNKAVANFFAPASKKKVEKLTWRPPVNGSLLIGHYGVTAAMPTAKGKRKIAAFDLDSTLIIPASGKKFGHDATDWKWWHSKVPGALRDLYGRGYLVTVLSNQAGISLKINPKTVKSDQKRLADFKNKVLAVFAQLDVPCTIFAATGRDQYRKPRTGMWQEFLEDNDLNHTDRIDLENSFFVGDAGGRKSDKGVGKDHSCADRDFAANVGIPFHTPEEYFLREESRPFSREFDPVAYVQQSAVKCPSSMAPFCKETPLDIVLLCGSPGAGKSTFYWKKLQPLGYGRVNQDILKTRENCLQAAASLVEEGTSVVVDNTNADRETRAAWIALAQKLHVPIRCVLFTASAKLCEHNDTVRGLNVGPAINPENRSLLPKLAFTGFASRFREPKLSEGFDDVVKVDFELDGDEAQKELWGKFWI